MPSVSSLTEVAMGLCSIHSRVVLLGKLTRTPEDLGQKALAMLWPLFWKVPAMSSNSVHVVLILQACGVQRVERAMETSQDLLHSSGPR